MRIIKKIKQKFPELFLKYANDRVIREKAEYAEYVKFIIKDGKNNEFQLYVKIEDELFRMQTSNGATFGDIEDNMINEYTLPQLKKLIKSVEKGNADCIYEIKFETKNKMIKEDFMKLYYEKSPELIYPSDETLKKINEDKSLILKAIKPTDIVYPSAETLKKINEDKSLILKAIKPN